jgi:hypothetical protein
MELDATAFNQIAADVPVPSTAFTLQRIRRAWDALAGDHPTKRALAAAGVDYMRTGYALLSMCLPPACVHEGGQPGAAHLVASYCRARSLPLRTVPIRVQHGLFLSPGVRPACAGDRRPRGL